MMLQLDVPHFTLNRILKDGSNIECAILENKVIIEKDRH